MRFFRRVLFLMLLLGGAASGADLNGIRDLIESGDFAVAKTQLQKALDEDPKDSSPRVLLARLLFLCRGTPGSTAELDRVSPEAWNAEAFWVRGLALADLGKTGEALADLRAAAYFGNEYQYMMDWGTTAWRFGRLEVAQEAFQFAQALEPTQPWPFLNLGMVLYGVDKPMLALQQLEKGVQVLEASGVGSNHPAYPELYYGRDSVSKSWTTRAVPVKFTKKRWRLIRILLQRWMP